MRGTLRNLQETVLGGLGSRFGEGLGGGLGGRLGEGHGGGLLRGLQRGLQTELGRGLVVNLTHVSRKSVLIKNGAKRKAQWISGFWLKKGSKPKKGNIRNTFN